jgi:pimeloyl-ACP methyl ester carboxylesterase
LQHPSIDPSKLFLFGRSLGGAVAVHAADYARRHQLPLAGVALENTFLSISAMVDHLMPYLTPIKPLVLNIHWDSSKLIGQLQVPLLFLCGGADELVPPQHMQHLVLLANRSVLKQVHVVQGGTHNECWMQGGAAYWDAMRAFVQQATSHNYAATTTTTTSSSSSAAGPATSSIPIMSSDLLGMAVGAQGGKSSSTRDKKKE